MQHRQLQTVDHRGYATTSVSTVGQETFPMRILIIGAGGHGEVVANILLLTSIVGNNPDMLGFLDDRDELHGQTVGSVAVLGRISDLQNIAHDALIVAIGDNRTRATLLKELSAVGEAFVCAVHPSAVIAPNVRIGPGSLVSANAVVNPGAIVGAGTIINSCALVGHHATVGDYVHIASGAMVSGNVVIEEGALLGVGSRVIPSRTVGRWSVVGAGATVIHDVPAYRTVVGTPARVIKQHEEPA
jgi:sugar O-acyltransferase (sialic acid O-acetyltransferase NeuD family)